MEVQPDFKDLFELFNLNKRATGRKQDAADLEALGEE